MKSQLILAAGLAFAFGGAAFAQDVPPTSPPVAEPASVDEPAPIPTDQSETDQPEAAPPEAAQPGTAPPEPAPPEAAQPEATGPHSTTVYHGAHKYPRKQRGRADEPPVIDHSFDTAPVPNPTTSSFTIVPTPA